jgi:hypothetical protein
MESMPEQVITDMIEKRKRDDKKQTIQTKDEYLYAIDQTDVAILNSITNVSDYKDYYYTKDFWGDDIHLLCACHLFKINICLVHLDGHIFTTYPHDYNELNLRYTNYQLESYYDDYTFVICENHNHFIPLYKKKSKESEKQFKFKLDEISDEIKFLFSLMEEQTLNLSFYNDTPKCAKAFNLFNNINK